MTALVRVIRPGFVAEIANIDLREPVSAPDVGVDTAAVVPEEQAAPAEDEDLLDFSLV